jgi:hypothetical protein
LLRSDAERPKIGACFDWRPKRKAGVRSGPCSGEGGGACPEARAERNRPGDFGPRLEPPDTGRAPAPRRIPDRDRGQASAWCETPKGNVRAQARTGPPGNGTRLASAATRPTQREPPRDPAAAVAGTVGAGSNAGPHLRLGNVAPQSSPAFAGEGDRTKCGGGASCGGRPLHHAAHGPPPLENRGEDWESCPVAPHPIPLQARPC